MRKRKTTALEIEIGNRIRIRRRQLGMSQTALGDRLGVRFQQIQRYEKGMCRVPASELSNVAGALDVPIGYLYGDDATAGLDATAVVGSIELLIERHAVDLLQCFQAMKSSQRNALLEIAKGLAAVNAHVPGYNRHGERSDAGVG
jgi:transcriptional regulator with XRE-family HTH domain